MASCAVRSCKSRRGLDKKIIGGITFHRYKMSGEVEVPKTPEWLQKLEAKREQRLKVRLGHEAGAGAPCLKCEDKCPGLDLHFWRKNCKVCKCSKEDHDTHDDDIYSWAQFELLGSKPNKIKTKIVLPGKKDEVELEWAPKGQKDIIDKYLKTLPPEKIPVKGSQAAQERKQALQKQIPIHDIDPSLCHELNEDEIQKMEEYIAHVKKSCVGVGQIVNLSNVIKANLYKISPQEAHIISTKYSKGIPYSELVKWQAGLARNLERLALNDPKNIKNKGSLPNMQPQMGYDNKEYFQDPSVGSRMRDINYQNYLNSATNENNPMLNPNYAQGLPGKQPYSANINKQIPVDYNFDEKLLQGTDFDPSKIPSQFKGYHTQGYRPLGGKQIPGDIAEQPERHFDDDKLMQNMDEVSRALIRDKMPYNVAYGENYKDHQNALNCDNAALPYNQLNKGFKPYDVTEEINVNNPAYAKYLGKTQSEQSLPYTQLKEGYKLPCVEDQTYPSTLPNLAQNLNKNVRNIQDPDNAEYVKNIPLVKHENALENYPSQLPQYAHNLAQKSQTNPGANRESYGFENPLYKNNQQNQVPLNRDVITCDNQNPNVPKTMKDLVYSTYDPSNALRSPDDPKFNNKVPYDDLNVPVNTQMINTQHGSLGYIPGTNTDQVQNSVDLRHPLLGKYGNIESNPAYTGELGSSQIKAGQNKVTGLKNMFEPNKNAEGGSSDPKNKFNSPYKAQQSNIDNSVTQNFPTKNILGDKGRPSAFYDPRVPKYALNDPNKTRTQEIAAGVPSSQDFNPNRLNNDPTHQHMQKTGSSNPENVFYDPLSKKYLSFDPRIQGSSSGDHINQDWDPSNPNYNPFNPHMSGIGSDYPSGAFIGPKGENLSSRSPNKYSDPNFDPNIPVASGTHRYDPRSRKLLPQLQPGSFEISEDFVNPDQVNIGAIRDINYPDNAIKEAMIASNPGEDFYGEDYSPDSIKELLNNIILPNCHYCKKPFEENEFAVTIERANVLFHADCFKCAGCNQNLADNIYFFHKESNNVYCGRDYAKIKGYPRCNACDELIFTKEYCLAENATFHLKHFCCFQCDTPLAGQEYTPENGQPYCLPCFELTKASKCSTCQNVIKPDERGCNLNGVHFHAEDECFCCIVCKKPLMGQKLLLRNEKLFCSHDCFNAVSAIGY